MRAVGLVGFGYWGPKLARAVERSEGGELVAICDVRPSRRRAARAAHPGVEVHDGIETLLRRADLDVVVVATPPDVHAAHVMAALGAGAHVLVEKPLALTATDAARVVAEAERTGRLLLVDHTYLYAQPVRALRELVQRGELGSLTSWESERSNVAGLPGPTTLIADLAVHDLAILEHVAGQTAVEVRAEPCAVDPHGRLQHAQLRVLHDDGLRADIAVRWDAPTKVRRAALAGTSATARYDDLGSDPLVVVRDGRQAAVPVAEGEPLVAVVEHMVDCIDGGAVPRSPGTAALRLAHVVAAAERSLLDGGRAVALEPAELVR